MKIDYEFMKKILCLLSILIYSPFVMAEDIKQSCLLEQKWEDIVPLNARVDYINPIKRPKWGYPLAWFGYAGTLFLVPFPLIMKNKDNAIANNNIEYARLQELRYKYEQNIQQCKKVYSSEKDLLPCYQQAKYNIYMELNMDIANKQYQEQQRTNRLLQYQTIQNNRPHYYHSTTTQQGNTYYTNTYGY